MSSHKPLAQRVEVKEFLAKMPTLPGVYLMKDREGGILYVGKAINLRSRVRSYFNASGDERGSVTLMRKRIFDIETVVTNSEMEALILENTLIKKHMPRYNVQLRDDKTFLGVRISVQEEVPRLSPVRRPRKDGAAYFGPYPSAFELRQVIRLLQKVFGMRVCSDTFFRNRTRPCLEYQIGRCLAPCVAGYVTREDYQKAVNETMQFLRGKSATLVESLQRKMQAASEAQDYETAIKVRDQLLAIESTLKKQVVTSHQRQTDQDFIGFYREEGFSEIYVLWVRAGQVVGGESFHLGNVFGEDEEILSSFLSQRYGNPERTISLPAEIVLPFALADAKLLCQAFGTKIHFPKKGSRKKLLHMAKQNARVNFEKAKQMKDRDDQVLQELTKKLHLPKIPERIECYDISNFQGSEAVGSLVVFSGTKADKKSYRHFKIRTVTGSNDYEMLGEILQRRFKNQEPHPDLLIVDGGKGQLQIAQTILRELSLDHIPLAGMAKARTLPDERGQTEERLFLPGRVNPVTFRHGSGALFLLQRIRDEAHRFAITHHRKLRKKTVIHSILDEIPGVGPSRRKKLLQIFGSVEGVRGATLAELQEKAQINTVLAQAIQKALAVS